MSEPTLTDALNEVEATLLSHELRGHDVSELRKEIATAISAAQSSPPSKVAALEILLGGVQATDQSHALVIRAAASNLRLIAASIVTAGTDMGIILDLLHATSDRLATLAETFEQRLDFEFV